MYDIRQFKPALYILLLLGVFGFSLAAESALLLGLGTLALLFNAWLIWRGWFQPMPRLVSNVVTIVALIYVVHEVFSSGEETVMLIGEFLMLLQMVKLWEQRGNRDYAQLLVLSLLLMVAAAISTASIFFALIMLAYLFISLYCCLLFHLKVETDAARATMGTAEIKPSSAVLRQDQRKLSQSMRKLTAVVSATSLAFAVAVFILFPRGSGAGMFGPVQFKPTQSLVGFSDEVSFQNIARIQQNEAIVAYATLKHNGQVVPGNIPLLLRGVTLDTYTGKEGAWRWVRWPRTGAHESNDDANDRQPEPAELFPDHFLAQGEIGRDEERVLALESPPADSWEQGITLLPTGTNVMFAMAGPYSIKPARPLNYRFSTRDGELRNCNHDRERRQGEIRYTIVSSNSLGNLPPPPGSGTAPEKIDPAILKYVLEHKAAGSNDKGSLAEQRLQHKRGEADEEADELDEPIARNIETYLKNRPFSYTLDLTDTRTIEGRDPLVAFLYDIHKGHCEYFAGAMTLMCQSLGMKARICLGFRCAEYNSTAGAGYYIVRQSHAHAWVEVFTRKGWMTFDPTSDLDSVEQAKHAGFMQKVQHVFDYLQFTYGNSIIAYSNEDRTNIFQRTESAMVRAAAGTRDGNLRAFGIDRLLASGKYWTISSGAILAAMLLMGAAALVVTVRYARDKLRLRKRAARIGISSLPRAEQMRLARQLEFYDDLVTLLGRHQIIRRPHETPLEFSRSLLYLPAGAYESIARLTGLFYRIRYGGAELTASRQSQLRKLIAAIAADLSGVQSNRAR